MPKKNCLPNSFDDRALPKNTLSKDRELEIDRLMATQLPEALEKLSKENETVGVIKPSSTK